MPPSCCISKNPRRRGHRDRYLGQVPAPVPPSEHPCKYRLVYVVDGKRIVGYDNERGKGDHKHIDGTEKTYRFVNPQRLIDDFMKDVKGAEHE